MSSAISVLLVDDTPDVRLLLKLLLSEDDRFTVVGEAGTGDEALSLVEQRRPEVVIMDLAMPGMDGLEALPEIKSRFPDTKVVVLSGFERGVMGDKALEAGAAAYFEKGGDMSHLVESVARVAAEDRAGERRSPPPVH